MVTSRPGRHKVGISDRDSSGKRYIKRKKQDAALKGGATLNSQRATGERRLGEWGETLQREAGLREYRVGMGR